MQSLTLEECVLVASSYVDVLTYETVVAIGVIIFSTIFMIQIIKELKKE